MKLETFKCDIREGEQLHCNKCVIALAYARLPMPKGADEVLVDGRTVRWVGPNPVMPHYDGLRITVAEQELPRVVKSYIKRFDKNKKLVRPTVFSVPDIPTQA